MAKKKQIDWDKIERDYRADVLSIAQISRESGAPSSTIRARAKRLGWSRNLTARIKSKADEIVNQDAIKNAVANIQSSEEQTIEENARLTAGVRLAHRKDIMRARLATNELLIELESMIGDKNRQRLDDLLALVLDVEDGIDSDDFKAIAAYKRAVSLSSAVSNMRNLADSMTKFISLERQAWNLDNLDDSSHDPLKTLLDSIASSNNNAFDVVVDDPEYDADTPARSNSIGVKDDD